MKASYRCDIGLKRASNQDSVLCVNGTLGPVRAFFAVADGMGGHKAGEVASAEMLRRMEEGLRASGRLPLAVRAFWRDLIVRAGDAVHALSETKEEYSSMGSTFVMASFFDERICVANIGDSRCYRLTRSGELEQITRDHSLVQEMVEHGSITKEEARIHPRRNVITRAVGVEEGVEPDFFFMASADCAKLLLCSDGLYSMVEDWEIEAILRGEQDPDAAAERLLQLALARGGIDNISVIVVDPEEDALC